MLNENFTHSIGINLHNVVLRLFSKLPERHILRLLRGQLAAITDKGQVKLISISRWTKGAPRGDILVYIKISFTKLKVNILSENNKVRKMAEIRNRYKIKHHT